GGQGACEAQGRDRSRPTRDRGRPALPVGHPHLSRWVGRGIDLASALFGRRSALAEGVTMRRLSLSAALAALYLAAGTPVHAQTPPTLPQGDGRDLAAVACSQCHTLAVLMAGRDGPVGWKNHVYNMVLRGAQLTPREA